MYKITKTLVLSLATVLIFAVCSSLVTVNGEKNEDVPNVGIVNPPLTAICEPIELVIEEPLAEEEQVSKEDIELIALVTMAEAEGECEEGKRLVINTILNRVDSELFPDTIYDVIYQPNQFSVIRNGRIDRCEVAEEICQLVREELECRSNYDVIFFTAGSYSKYGVPIFQVGNHYFSSYD